MLDIGWQELLVIGALALLVVGPKELPGLLRSVGRYAGKARSMAREFQRSMEDAAREADLEEFNKLKNMKSEVEGMAKLDFKEQAKRSQSFMTGGAGKPAEQPAEGAAPKPAAVAGEGAAAPAPAAPAAAPAPAPAAAPAPAPAAAPSAPAPSASAAADPAKSGTHD
ncbi:hypothetical protein LNKW23_14560 [Paralimibaculum aggregatum]|uniref:Sec-independent protein translocase protein TatB n=1 Tax=Paralimibaculum aggregatum TaxID=3036245 RepID=A0ABQ6LLX8_9RHOB|nr:Sec-independent protein translocase protein TatB [Limibaculum sp. NKW23]GMG82243.1 hypothetical protein LNKW23_14560 [Limibaculum sp. NKW23]